MTRVSSASFDSTTNSGVLGLVRLVGGEDWGTCLAHVYYISSTVSARLLFIELVV